METKIYNLEPCQISDRNGSYGGSAGQKEGILIDGQYWMVKYPKSTREMQNVGSLSYNTAPLSEYIGSHVYGILGYDVHETILGVRNDTVVVACKDMCDDTHTLREFRELKNTYNKQLNEQLTLTSSLTSTHENHFIQLDQIMVHLKYNPELQKIPGLKERFWDCIIIDGFINNNDRNDGNWGILRSKTDQFMAPIFDNGSSFAANVQESKIRTRLEDDKILEQAALNGRSAYSLNNERQAFFAELLNTNIPEIQQAVKRVVPNIENHMQQICDFINKIPERAGDRLQYTVITPERKKEYCKELICRDTKMLVPALERTRQLDRQEREKDEEFEL